jgi:DNA-binding transcriptional ArsR family regulator
MNGPATKTKVSAEALAALFQAPGDRTRLRLLNLLADGDVRVCFFVEGIDEP